ncbi:hypothetical protein LCGC14_2215890, partial [marine sediment metagenome]
MQEDLERKVARLDRRVKELEEQDRLRALGLMGGDIEATLQQHTAVLGKLIGDQTLGNILMGPFPGAAPPQVFRRADGSFYSGGTMGVWPEDQTFMPWEDRLWTLPFYMPSTPNFIDEIGIEVSQINVGGAGNARLGIYDDDGTIYPGKLIKDAGSVITGLRGQHFATVNESTPRGLKWLVVLFDITVELSMTAILQSAGSWALLGTGPPNPFVNLNIMAVGYRVAWSYGPLPNVYPSG